MALCACSNTDQKKIEAGKGWKGRKYVVILVGCHVNQLESLREDFAETIPMSYMTLI